MKTCCAVGDASDFMAETPRTPFMKKVKNMGFSDKVHHTAARGTSFCSANGMHIIMLALVFGRCPCDIRCQHDCALAPWSLHDCLILEACAQLEVTRIGELGQGR